jgi:DNA polymerase-3 subunit delta
MKLAAKAAAQFCARPPSDIRGALLYGEDAGQVAAAREALLAALLGPNAEAEMRLERVPATELRAGPAALDAALRAQGFFPGPRAALVVGASDGAAKAVAAVLADAARPDAFLLVTADALGPRSSLRTTFETARDAVALPFYPEPPGREAIEAMASAAGAASVDAEAAEALRAMAGGMDRGALTRLVETAALYAGPGAPLDAAAVAACAPPSPGEAGADAAVDAALTGQAAAVRAQLARLAARGASPVEIVMAALRRLRLLHRVAAGGDAARAAAMRVYPMASRETATAAARRLGPARLEAALARLLDVDAALRGGSDAPPMALLERALLRLAGEARR